jgi:hypothetical protein
MYGSGWQLRSRGGGGGAAPAPVAGGDHRDGRALAGAQNRTGDPREDPGPSTARDLQAGEPAWAEEMPPAEETKLESVDSWAALREVGLTDELVREMRAFFEPYEFGLRLLLEALPVLGVHVA